MEVNQLHPGNGVNDATQKSVNTHSAFSPSRRVYQTMRFGEYCPHFVMETVPKDKISLRSSHDIRSYTLKAPLMSDLSIKKDYFNVPLQAILPFNADKLITNALLGDDVNAQTNAKDVNCGVDQSFIVSALNACILNCIDALSDYLEETPSYELTLEQTYSLVLRYYVLLEYFLSSGSLLRNLGQSLSTCYYNENVDPTTLNYFDADMEFVITQLISLLGSSKRFNVLFSGDEQVTMVDMTLDSSYSEKRICFREFLERIRQNPLFEISANQLTDSDDLIITAMYNRLVNASAAMPDGAQPNYFSFARAAAYQMVVHHYYSNDKIDYIYSAELFRQLMSFYACVLNGDFYATFTFNGVSTQYDFLSGMYIKMALGELGANSPSSLSDMYGTESAAFNYLSALLSFRRSLRYVDYFTGAKSQPLAVGDTGVAVAHNLVNVVDVTQKIQVQRFLNAVNRAGRKLADYVSGIFGITPAYDYHDPAWLGHTADSVRCVETENTGEAQWTTQNSVSGVFRSNAERYSFEFESDRPSILIGITYFDIPRCYAFSNDRQTTHVDRFDMFNPYMQFIGDQPEYLSELGVLSDEPFAYTLRHMEYKQSFDIACGGFIDNLPGWAFTTPLTEIQGTSHINPHFIRSRNYELDRFYLILSGHTLANYFHFIVANTNYVDAKRPMAYAPSIL